MIYRLIEDENLAYVKRHIKNYVSSDDVGSLVGVNRRVTYLTYRNQIGVQFSITIHIMSSTSADVGKVMFGVSVGDVIQHHIHTTDTDIGMSVDTENDKVSKRSKRSKMMGVYLHQKKQIRPVDGWLVDKSVDRDGWAGYCQSIICLSADDVSHLINYKTGHIKDREAYTLFNNISNATVVDRLLQYYLHGEVPYITPSDGGRCVFDQPVSLLEILENQPDQRRGVICELTKKLNKRQTMLLDSHPVSIFTNICGIPASYPFYAYRKVMLTEFNPRHMNDLQVGPKLFLDPQANSIWLRVW